MMQVLKRNLFLLPLLCRGELMAQSPKWSALVPPIPAEGLYAITLSAELLGCSKADLGDVRLLDSTGAQVPYVIKGVWKAAAFPQFAPYVLLRNEVLAHSTVIELERPEGEALDQLHIWIRPLDAEKKVRITGSDDRTNWYMVKDEHLVPQGARGDPPHQVLIVDIPRSDYRYFMLTLNDSLTAPMKVLVVGRFDYGNSATPRYIDAAPLAFIQRDSAGTSVLTVQRAQPLLVERMLYAVRDTTAHARSGSLRSWSRMPVFGRLRSSMIRVPNILCSFTLTSDASPMIEMNAARLDTFDVVVENGDDRPLHFTELRPQVRHRVLIAQLSPGMSYRITTGDAALRPPQYDMAHFASELPVPVDTLLVGALEAIPGPAIEGPVFDPSKWWIWAAIIALLLGMGWMALRMLRKS